MAARRRFFAPAAAAGASEMVLDEAESHRLLRVLRLRPGAAVEAFDGAGNAWQAQFVGESDEPGRCLLERGESLPSLAPPVRLTVAVAIPKGDEFTRIVRQLAEVGAAVVTPLTTEHSEGSPAASRLPRWQAAALSGTRQCGRALVPTVSAPVPFASWIEGEHPPRRWIASPVPLPRARPEGASEPADAVVAIGPEGGFAPAELEAAAAHGFASLDLGPRVLRTGTAAVVAAALLLREHLNEPPARR